MCINLYTYVSAFVAMLILGQAYHNVLSKLNNFITKQILLTHTIIDAGHIHTRTCITTYTIVFADTNTVHIRI